MDAVEGLPGIAEEEFPFDLEVELDDDDFITGRDPGDETDADGIPEY